jgi:hypothetical protein
MPCEQESGCGELAQLVQDGGGESTATATAIVVVMELLFAATFVLGSVLNTLLVVVYCRRRGFRAQISNRCA